MSEMSENSSPKKMYLRYSRWLADANGNPKQYLNRKTFSSHKKKMLALSPTAVVLFPHIDCNGTGMKEC
jgi:hypothetical protein